MRRVCRKRRLSEGWWPLPGSVGGLRSDELQTHCRAHTFLWCCSFFVHGGSFKRRCWTACFTQSMEITIASFQVSTRQIPLKKRGGGVRVKELKLCCQGRPEVAWRLCTNSWHNGWAVSAWLIKAWTLNLCSAPSISPPSAWRDPENEHSCQLPSSACLTLF